jgi:acetoacetyl-CoA synthetase
VSHKPEPSPLVEMLKRIWQHVLQRPSIGVDDHFFDVGGSLESADLLFAAIAQECGRELPSATIYHAPTIAALASLLEQPALPEFSPFVQVKAGDKQPPILIVHGLAGTVPFFELAKCMETGGHPVYGIQAKGVDGMEDPLESVEDMAEFYLESLRKFQPHGPYILIGYSFGGLVTLEMAQRMLEAGENVSLLVLVVAYPDTRCLSWSQRLLLYARRARRHLARIWHRSVREKISYVVREFRERLHIAGVPEPDPGASRLSFARTTLSVKEKARVALARYRPRLYAGKISFVKSEEDRYFPADPAAVWAHLAAGFEVETVPGGHLDMVTEDYESLAAVLTRYLKKVPSPE